MNASEATEKIRKLLKRNGRTEAEADTASILAAAIAEKHGIDIAGLDQAEEDRRSEITHKVIIEWVTTPPITRVNFTQQQVFVGTERHIQIAEYIFRFLLTEFRWQWNRKRGRCKNRKQFLFGCFIALHAKLRERFARPAGAALELEISCKSCRQHIPYRWAAAGACRVQIVYENGVTRTLFTCAACRQKQKEETLANQGLSDFQI